MIVEFMSSGGATVGDQWVQGVVNHLGPCRTVNVCAARTPNSGAWLQRCN